MKKKTFSISILLVLTFSMAYSSFEPTTNNVGDIYEPISADSPDNAILVFNDELYYNVAEEVYDETEERYYDDSFVVKLVVNETDPNYIKYMPYFHEFDGNDWTWVEDIPDGDDPHLYDDYTYGVYNHSWSINTTITDISAVNATENIQGKFATDIGASVVTAYFSTGADLYHNVTLSGLKDDDPTKPVFIQWIGDKTTGLCLYYEEKGMDQKNITAELCGYEIFDPLSTGLLPAPNSFGFAIGDWVDYFLPESERHDDPLPPPTSSGDSYFYDWLERGNDYWTTAFDLNSEFEVPGMWHDLSLYENFDYYSFHAESGDNIIIDANCENGADIVLERIEPGNGNIMVFDSEDGDNDGWIHLDWTATYSGDYMIGFTSDYGPFSDWYNFQISINGLYGPDYHPGDEPHDDDDGPESMFIHQTIEFLYTNPFGEDVLVAKSEGHKDADMMDAPLFVDYREQGRIHPGEIDKIEGPYFHWDLDMNSIEFQNSMEALFFEQEGVTISTFNSNTYWAEMIGTDLDGAEFYFFVERFQNLAYGGIQYYEMSLYNNTDGYFIKKDKNIAIDSSITGLINDIVPELGVSVGDEWTYLAQENGYENNWDEYGGYSRSYDNLHSVTITVTHVFHVNRTVVAVIGEMYHWSNDDPDYPDHREFMPILVWDTVDPMSFFNMGGHGQMQDGPPFLLPAGVDWSLLESDFTTMMESFMDEGSELKLNIDTNSVRIAWSNEDSYGNSHGSVYLDVDSNGIVTHIAQEEQKKEENYERRNRLEGFAVEIIIGGLDECASVPASGVTEVGSGDVFVWENQRYRPASSEDPGRDPANYTHIRNHILTVEEACDGFIVFLGSIEERKWDETVYTGKTWKYWDETINDFVDTTVNLWQLGSIQDGNIWSWVNSQYFDIGIANFSSYEADLIELLNFAMELPEGITITPADVTIDGLTFEVVLSFEENPGDGIVDHIMRFAVNNKGIMQEMFRGSQADDGTWLEWEYTVLIDAPDGYDTGSVLPDLPVEDPHDLDGGEPSLFDIPGYSTTVVMVVSIFAIFSLIALISNRRRS